MNLKQKKHTGKMSLAILAIMSVLLLSITLITYSIKTVPTNCSIDKPIKNSDKRAEKIKPDFFDKISPNKKDEFTYEINTSPVFKGKNKKGDVKIANPSCNLNLMQVEIALKENESVIFRSGLLKPGEKITSASLDHPLPEGKYEATAFICAVSPDTFELLGFLEQPINIKIKN